jgi:hypothetical protein
MNSAVFFISTARSGTQWLCESFRQIYPDLLVAEHEPIRYAYSPKRCLRNASALAELRRHPTVRRHLDGIHGILKGKSYVEVGFPAFAAAPLLWQEFGERLRLVQLVRHPVRVAASIVTHRWFDPGSRSDIQADIALSPADPGVLLRHYEARWADMSAYEKALFYWAEVHLFGMEVQDRFAAVPFLRVTLESLLMQETSRASLAHFIGLPYRPEWNDAAGRRIDSYRRRTLNEIDSYEIRSLPEIANLAARLGYDVDAVAKWEIQQRYRQSWLSRLHRHARSALRRTFAIGAATVLAALQSGDVFAQF